MNIYLIDDDAKKHDLLDVLLGRLNKNSSLSYKDGFHGKSRTACMDSSKLIEAVTDPEGILLLDIDLSGFGENYIAADILEDMRSYFQGRNQEIIDFYDNNTTIKWFKSKPQQWVASFILAASIVL
jgi:hypothetical protein